MTTGVVSAAPAATLRAARGELRGAITRHDHRQRAAGIRRAQARPEVVRILHAIERQQQRCAHVGERGEQVILAPGAKRGDLRGHALVGDLTQSC